MKANLVARVAQWLANEVIVKGLANSRVFQQFAVRSHGAFRQYAERGTSALRDAQNRERLEQLRSHSSSMSSWLREFGQGLAEVVGKRGGSSSGSGGGGYRA